MKIPAKALILSIDELANEFIGRAELNKSRNTARGYRCDIARFLDYLAKKKITNIRKVTSTDITNHFKTLSDAGRSPNTICRHYGSIRAFYRFLRQIKAIHEDCMESMETPKSLKVKIYVPSQADMRKFLDRLDVSTYTMCRNRAIFELVYSSGLRCSEMMELELCDITAQGVTIHSGKGDKTRTVPVSEEARKWINRWVFWRGEEEGYLFLTENKCKVTNTTINGQLKNECAMAKVPMFTMHSIRHACATHMLEKGADIRFIQKMLGHESIDTTVRYTELTSDTTSEMFKKYNTGKEQNG